MSTGSTHAQQLVYTPENKEKLPESVKCLRQLFEHDLCKVIDKYINLGDQMIVCDDFNSEYSILSN